MKIESFIKAYQFIYDIIDKNWLQRLKQVLKKYMDLIILFTGNPYLIGPTSAFAQQLN